MRSRLKLSEPEEGRYRSLGLKAWFDQNGPSSAPSILDLGPASGSNLSFFHEMGARLHVADLYRSLSETGERSREDPAVFERACSRMLPDPSSTSFDLILTWDLLNYFSEQEIRTLARHLRGYCRRRTFLFSLISIRHQLPAHPLSFQILDPGSLSYSVPSRVLRPCPEYKEPHLLRLLRGSFEVRRCFLLRHGYKEYLLASTLSDGAALGEESPPSP